VAADLRALTAVDAGSHVAGTGAATRS
jgi:hypothetical protein